MKRFYKAVAAVEDDGGYRIELDGRVLKTPKRSTLLLPGRAMADAIAREWDVQGDMIDPVSMPFTGFANAAVDHVGADRRAFAAGIAAYGESDLLCYRAGNPQALTDRQAAAWDPLLDWARTRYDVSMTLVEGVMHVPQPEPTLIRLSAALDAFDDFALAAAQPIVTISGSLVVTLALLEREVDVETAWAAGQLDELWQAETWGEDDEAARVRAHHHENFTKAAAFLELR
ncbi:ATPase [Pacificimonas sp. WHA3]|uniref:ATPase n=1 Tax=Pacificimonas pallii TaxID=2827236 RepID=A0ABS6SCM1_9SPHN|nr:ATP12 family protein [Pacificimonas pallii]MBV7256160.1 ATPase [Pacificimonas pallii]